MVVGTIERRLAWIERQPWFSGKIAMFGPSYLGIVQWAVATDPPQSLRALAAPISSARVRAFTYPEGTFSLESTLAWLGILLRVHHETVNGSRRSSRVERA